MPWPHVYCVPVAEGLYEYQLCKTHITTIKRVMVKCMFMIATLTSWKGFMIATDLSTVCAATVSTKKSSVHVIGIAIYAKWIS